MKRMRFKIEGVVPCMMHNGQLADPFNKFAKALKELSSKRSKTDDIREQMAQLEFLGSLYMTKTKPSKPCWPAANLHAMIHAASKRQKRGNDSKAAVFVVDDAPLIYDGPTDPNELYEDDRFRDYRGVGVNNATVYRTRPIFREWQLEFEVDFLEGVINPSDMIEWVTSAGIFIGLSDYKPQYGRFKVLGHEEVEIG